MSDAECDEGKICWAGVCVAEPPCEQSKCPPGHICHEKLQICVPGCDKDHKTCPMDQICSEKIKTCIISMVCLTDFNCPVDMACQYEDQPCSGQNGCQCVPRNDCKCSRGVCMEDLKICALVRNKCTNCGKNFMCPKYPKETQTQRCIPICNPKDPSSCPSNKVCMADMESKYGCVDKPYCDRDPCPPPLTCKGGLCEPPDCSIDSECGLFHICYSNVCQKIPSICTNNQQCQGNLPCLVGPEKPIGICNDCQNKCPAEQCKNGLCELFPHCLVDLHCDPYHKCENNICRPKDCENCKGKI